MALGTVTWHDGFTYTGATGSTVGPYPLLGGKYLWYGSVAGMTQAAQQYFAQNRTKAVLSSGLLKLPGGVFEQDGRIVTFY